MNRIYFFKKTYPLTVYDLFRFMLAKIYNDPFYLCGHPNELSNQEYKIHNKIKSFESIQIKWILFLISLMFLF
jgi:hypothetical protein